MNTEAGKLLRSLKRQGWKHEQRGNGHILLISPNGQTLTMAATPSDHRALKNVMADVRRLTGASR
jgi:hypothetical protein